MKFLIALFVPVLLFSTTGKAQSSEDETYEQVKQYYRQSYNEMHSICAQKNRIKQEYLNGKQNLTAFLRGAKSMVLPGRPAEMLSLNPATKKFINSDGYWDALTECYPGNSLMWQAITASLILYDAEGHLIAGAASFMIGAAIFKYIGGTAWAIAHPSVMLWGSRLFVSVGGLALLKQAYDVGMQIYDRKQAERHPIETLKKQDQKIAKGTSFLYGASVQAMVERLEEVNDELAHNRLDEHCMAFPEQTRAQACHAYLLERKVSLEERIVHQKDDHPPG